MRKRTLFGYAREDGWVPFPVYRLFRRAISSSYSASHVDGGPKRVRLLTTAIPSGTTTNYVSDGYDDDDLLDAMAQQRTDTTITSSCCLPSLTGVLRRKRHSTQITNK
jgi:hypothetical protein